MEKRTALAMLAALSSAGCADESTTGPEVGVAHRLNANVSAQASPAPADSSGSADSAEGEARGAYIGAGF